MEMIWKEDGNGIEVLEQKFEQARKETLQAQLYSDITGDAYGNAHKPADSNKWTVMDYGVYVMTEDELQANYIDNQEVYYFVEDFLHEIFPEDIAEAITEKFGDYCDRTLDGRPLADRLAELIVQQSIGE